MPEGELILEVEEMLLMYTMTYPTTSASEFGKAVVKNFQEHAFPDFIKLSGPIIQFMKKVSNLMSL